MIWRRAVGAGRRAADQCPGSATALAVAVGQRGVLAASVHTPSFRCDANGSAQSAAR